MKAKFTKFHKNSNRVDGMVDKYKFQAKLYDVGSQYGINEGRVSKLVIWDRKKGLSKGAIISYDRGWDVKPNKEAKPYFDAVMDLLEKSPKRFENMAKGGRVRTISKDNGKSISKKGGIKPKPLAERRFKSGDIAYLDGTKKVTITRLGDAGRIYIKEDNKPEVWVKAGDLTKNKSMSKGGGIKPKPLKVTKEKNFWHIRFTKPDYTEYAIPKWAQKVAGSIHKGAKCTMGKKYGKWELQNVMIPIKGVDKARAEKLGRNIACKVDYKCRTEMKASKKKGGEVGEKRFVISFTGRKSGAIGKSYRIRETVYAKNIEDAIMKLYDNYDSIIDIKVNGKKYMKVGGKISKSKGITRDKYKKYNNQIDKLTKIIEEDFDWDEIIRKTLNEGAGAEAILHPDGEITYHHYTGGIYDEFDEPTVLLYKVSDPINVGLETDDFLDEEEYKNLTEEQKEDVWNYITNLDDYTDRLTDAYLHYKDDYVLKEDALHHIPDKYHYFKKGGFILPSKSWGNKYLDMIFGVASVKMEGGGEVEEKRGEVEEKKCWACNRKSKTNLCEKCEEEGWWIDPSGGLHQPDNGDYSDPAAMYE